MGHDDDQVAHWFCDQWKALGIGEGQADEALATCWFPGPAGRESAGIVDLLAIRKNHKSPSHRLSAATFSKLF